MAEEHTLLEQLKIFPLDEEHSSLTLPLQNNEAGLVLVNLINGFCTVGFGNLLLVADICTHICVLDFLASVLSARNHGLLHPLEEIVLCSSGCSTCKNYARDTSSSVGGMSSIGIIYGPDSRSPSCKGCHIHQLKVK
eukprot:TRINITY_DN39109_c0_g1_i1.p1 TRINITY_DN39109_c0_g1~~TRINITY_DN39109_c0_g1_i1.p1  ORF type:complete len:137 (+),score=14.46 TRINITY_DN39109_c0_g1_i1:196-606(+)